MMPRGWLVAKEANIEMLLWCLHLTPHLVTLSVSVSHFPFAVILLHHPAKAAAAADSHLATAAPFGGKVPMGK